MSLKSGQSALLPVEEEPRPGQEVAPTLHQLMTGQTVREKAVRLKTAIIRTVQVKLISRA